MILQVICILQADSLFIGSQVTLKMAGSVVGQTYDCGGNTISADQLITLGPKNTPATGQTPGNNEGV